MSIKFIWTIPSTGTHEINADSIEDLRQQIKARQLSLSTIRRIGGTCKMTADSVEEAQKAAEYMSQLKQVGDMTKKAEVAQNIANAFAPGCKVVLVHN